MKKAELVFVPVPAMGHLISTVELAKLLVDLNPNLYITLLTIKPSYDATLTAYSDSLSAKATSTRITFVNLPQPETNKDFTLAKLLIKFNETQRPLIKEAVTNIVQFSSSDPDSPQLAGFVLDMVLAGLVDLADEFDVPSYVFYTSGAASVGFHLYMQALHDEQNVKVVELKHSDTELAIPSYANPVSTKFFPSMTFKPDHYTQINDMARRLRAVKGIMVNTFLELESHAVDSLTDGRLPSVYPVGPILNMEGTSGCNQNCDTIMEWLDDQPPSSVVFLCFGSMGSFGVDQVREIACALERSGHRFLWSLRQPPDVGQGIMASPTDYHNVAEVLPEGFLDRTAGIGKIVGWAPQVAILGHKATGGFVSHCGWNSTLESIWFGVPMATWPVYAEQQLNAFTLVKELGIAVEIKMDYRNDIWGGDEVEIVNAEKIERGIRCLMEQDSDVRRRAKEMSKRSRMALMDGGSSHSTLCRLIDNVMDNVP